jgi:hypothetical protein
MADILRNTRALRMTRRDAEDLVLMSTASRDSEFEVIPVTARLLAYLAAVKPGGPAGRRSTLGLAGPVLPDEILLAASTMPSEVNEVRPNAGHCAGDVTRAHRRPDLDLDAVAFLAELDLAYLLIDPDP